MHVTVSNDVIKVDGKFFQRPSLVPQIRESLDTGFKTIVEALKSRSSLWFMRISSEPTGYLAPDAEPIDAFGGYSWEQLDPRLQYVRHRIRMAGFDSRLRIMRSDDEEMAGLCVQVERLRTCKSENLIYLVKDRGNLSIGTTSNLPAKISVDLERGLWTSGEIVSHGQEIIGNEEAMRGYGNMQVLGVYDRTLIGHVQAMTQVGANAWTEMCQSIAIQAHGELNA